MKEGSKTANPKSEARNPKEGRSPKPEIRSGESWSGVGYCGFRLFQGLGWLTQRRKDAKTQREKWLWEVKYERSKHAISCHHFLVLLVRFFGQEAMEQRQTLSMFRNLGITSLNIFPSLRLCVFASLRYLPKTLAYPVAHKFICSRVPRLSTFDPRLFFRISAFGFRI